MQRLTAAARARRSNTQSTLRSQTSGGVRIWRALAERHAAVQGRGHDHVGQLWLASQKRNTFDQGGVVELGQQPRFTHKDFRPAWKAGWSRMSAVPERHRHRVVASAAGMDRFQYFGPLGNASNTLYTMPSTHPWESQDFKLPGVPTGKTSTCIAAGEVLGNEVGHGEKSIEPKLRGQPTTQVRATRKQGPSSLLCLTIKRIWWEKHAACQLSMIVPAVQACTTGSCTVLQHPSWGIRGYHDVCSVTAAFHAGNHADVLKHSVLIATLQHLIAKDTALMVLDTTPVPVYTGWMVTMRAPVREAEEGFKLAAAAGAPPPRRFLAFAELP